MRIVVAVVAHKAPDWVETGYREYARRLRDGVSMELRKVPPARVGKAVTSEQRLRDEAVRLAAVLPQHARVTGLDRRGAMLEPRQLASRLESAMVQSQDLAFVIGSADGLDRAALGVVSDTWSLGRTTLPHHLVRIIVAEQIYRAWALLQNLPYHRGH